MIQWIREPRFRASLIYGISSLAAAAVWLGILPVLARFLTAEDFGIYGIFRATLNLMMPVVGLSGSSYVTWRFTRLEKSDLALDVGAIAVASGILAIPLVLLAMVTGSVWETMDVERWVVPVAVGVAWFGSWNAINESRYQMVEQPWPFFAVRIGVVAVTTGGMLYAVLILDWGWQALVWGQVVGLTVVGLASLTMLFRARFIRIHTSVKRVWTIVRFGVPLVPHVAGMWTANYIDRFIIASLVGLAEAGLYTIAYSVSMVLSALHEGVSRAFAPRVALAIADPTSENRFGAARFVYYYAFWAGLVSLLMIPILAFALRSFGGELAESVVFLPWLILAQWCFGISRVLTGYLLASDLIFARSTITAVIAIVNVVASFAAVSFLGAIGAAYATVASFGVGAVATFGVARRRGILPGYSDVRKYHDHNKNDR